MTEALDVSVSSVQENRPPNSHPAARLGKAALPEVRFAYGVADLTEQENRVLVLASHGGTVAKVSKLLSAGEEVVGEEEVKELSSNVMDAFRSRTMAEAVHRAIQQKRITIKPSDSTVKLTESQKSVIRLTAAGYDRAQIAKKMGKRRHALDAISRNLWVNKLGATGPVHGIRKAHEFGLL